MSFVSRPRHGFIPREIGSGLKGYVFAAIDVDRGFNVPVL
jgi:hypothetical protein